MNYQRSSAPRFRRVAMGWSGLAGCATVFCLSFAALAAPPPVQELVDKFNPTNYYDLVANRLYTRQGMDRTAGIGAENALCRQFILAELQRYGLDAYEDVFPYVDTSGVPRIAGNVIAVRPGVQNPNNEIFVIGSHFDSEENPGADDNATGVATLLEMARIFNEHHFARTIVFCAFDAEEIYDFYGARRLGSTRFANQHLAANIKGMVSVDMIGWQSSGSSSNQAWIYGRPGVMDPIRNDLAAAVTSHGGGLQPVLRAGDGDYSDHVAFANAGFQACLFIEGNFSANPNYHKLTDYVEMPGYLDWTYAGKMSRAAIGYFATKLEPVDVTPRVLSLQPGTNGELHLTFQGLPRCQYAVELSTNLLTSDWVAVATNTASATEGLFTHNDAEAGGRAAGFYRARFVSGYTGSPGLAPIFTTQPLSRVADAGQSVTFHVEATGAGAIEYQWLHNGATVPGASSNTFTREALTLADAGTYAVVASNDSGSTTSRVATLTVHPPQLVVFVDDFDTDSAPRWTLNRNSESNTRVTFHYDYAADGIPPAPNAIGGTTRAVKLEANMSGGATAALNLSPVGGSFSGDHRLRFHMWINANGPFPLGGRGSTEYVTGGLGTTGNRVQWTGSGSTADGCWFAVNGEGQAGDTSSGSSDYGASVTNVVRGAASGVYAAGTNANARGNGHPYYTTAFPAGQTPPAWQQSHYAQQTGALAGGTVGFHWRDVVIARRGNVVEWSIDGVSLASITNAPLAGSNVFIGYWDPFTSISDNPALSFGLVDNVRVEVPAP